MSGFLIGIIVGWTLGFIITLVVSQGGDRR